MTKTHILIVEDEGLIAKDLQGILRRLGYHVPMTVGTGEQAVASARENRPDLILMDIQLRGEMDGVEAAASITAERDVPILYLTANSDEATFLRAKGTDPFGFLVKPYEERSLQAGIEMALYKHAAERQTKEREQWLSTTLGSIADAVITTDSADRITFLNIAAERLLGWAREDAQGVNCAEILGLEGITDFPPSQVSPSATEVNRDPARRLASVKRRDGSPIEVEFSVAPLRRGPDREIHGHVIVLSDVSERRQLEEKLRHAQKMDAIGKLAGGIAHDFNNAITAIIGYAELILGDNPSDRPQSNHARQIVRAAEHSARLTHQLLAFSRKQVLQPRSISLEQQVLEIEGMVRRLIGADVTLQTSIPRGLWNILADPGQIHQVILNMSINARDAMPQGGTLMISVRNITVTSAEALRIPEGRPGEFVLLQIADTGTGMTPEVQAHIFEPFFTTKEPGKGTGLGLATCYGIVRQTSGMISVASEVGKGTTFSIYLPKAAADEGASSAKPSSDNAPRGRETILIVEDEEILRELAIQVLEGFGYKILSAADGVEATEILNGAMGSTIDLVVTDLVMPRMSGRDLITWMGERFSHVRVLFMSGYTDDEIIRSAVCGAEVQYLQKPFTPKTLAQKVRETLDSGTALALSCPAA
jgi:two-component system, cell cycle sensor histidine kinase and response regulator CckA